MILIIYINMTVTAWFKELKELVSKSNKSIIKNKFLEADNIKSNSDPQNI
ncbi:2703_t:CDS:2 [Cetraspora pellucida]|uniref:2703_t:CDS:1 n=1 Tax=Cetraspora pellucida TaxID=1433469 RepID=A0ACA9JZ90_9GLOM|nr:2703_t:CDS:2 [Cetraspora pellucida]